jgi:DNA-binding NarL/FixJ family response regulator
VISSSLSKLSGIISRSLPPQVTEAILARFNTGEPERLTAREREIVQLLAEGKSSMEVASSLRISIKTVETHRSNVMQKLEIHNVSELVRYAVRNQIIEA